MTKFQKLSFFIWLFTLIIFFAVGLYSMSLPPETTVSEFWSIVLLVNILVGVLAFLAMFFPLFRSLFGKLVAPLSIKNTAINASTREHKTTKTYLRSNKSIVKYFVVGIFILLLLITYQLYQQSTDTPKTKLDCLKLGSDKRAEACLELLKQNKPQEEFPISYLSTENTNATTERSCIKVSGAIKNSYSLPAQFIMIRIDFSKTQDSEPFHYEVFSPFDSEDEQLQPNSKKTFSECLRRQSYDAVKDVQNWYFSVTPYSAKIYKE